MDASLKKILRGISLELRHTLEGWHDKKTGIWNPGDLERRLNEIGAWGDRPSKPLDEMPHLSAEDKAARRLVDGYLQLRAEAGVERAAAVAEFVRESAYTWANRLFALRCMEARSIIEEVILQKAAYAGRSLVHQRYLRKNPDAAKGEDDGLFAVLFTEFAVRCQELPALFDPKSPAVALRPSVPALKRCVALLSGTESVRGQDPATDEVFSAPDALGWAYQHYQDDEKERVDDWLKTRKGFKCEGCDIIPKTALYTASYMVRFIVQNSLGALWMEMYPDSTLCNHWEYYVKNVDRVRVAPRPIRNVSFLDPAQGSGHFHLEAFDLFYAMYEEESVREGRTLTPREICATILNHNLFGIDIDERAVQIATVNLWMKAKEKAAELEPGDLTTFHRHQVATNIRLPRERDQLEVFLQKHPEDAQLRPALELVFKGLEHADELGALLQIEEPVNAVFRQLKQEAEKSKGTPVQRGLFEPTLVQATLPVTTEDYDKWKREALDRLQMHFEAESQAADLVQSFFGESAGKGLALFDLLARRYDVIAANPPFMGRLQMGRVLVDHLTTHYRQGQHDLLAAFFIAAQHLLSPGGIFGCVGLHNWMFLSGYSALREHVFEHSFVRTVAHLGPGTMKELSNPNAQGFSLQVLQKGNKESSILDKVGIYYRAADDDDKMSALRQKIKEDEYFKRSLRSFREIPGQPLCYWLPSSALRFLASPSRLKRIVSAKAGLATGDNPRWTMFWWEPNLRTASNSSDWVSCMTGGDSRSFYTSPMLAVRWGTDGILLKDFRDAAGKLRSRPQNVQFYNQEGLTFSKISSRRAYAKFLPKGHVFLDTSRFLEVSPEFRAWVLCYLNSRIAAYLLQALAPTVSITSGDIERLPYPPTDISHVAAELTELTSFIVQCRYYCESEALTSKDWQTEKDSSSLAENIDRANQSDQIHRFAVSSVMHATEFMAEKKLSASMLLDKESLDAVFSRCGAPVGALPFVAKFDALPPLSARLPELPRDVLESLERHERRLVNKDELDELKKHLRELYEAGPGSAAPEPELEELGEEENGEHEETVEMVAQLRIPAETFIEQLSQNLGVHPTSVYWLLQEGIESEGWRCSREERRLTENRFTVMVLQWLGHRWPKQIEAAEPLPVWADQDGVIPLTSGGGEVPLFNRVSERLTEDFPGGNVAALTSEFEEIVGVPLEQWLVGPFFERHISQFKKRPIAWQLETVASRQAALPGGKGKKKRAVVGKPVFACLIYYHKLDADLLPKIRTQYVGLLNGGFETEFRTLERVANPSDDQQARRLQLEQWTDELQAFDRLLEDVSLRGFGPDALRPALRRYGINDALLSLTASWLRRLSETVVKVPLKDWMDAAAKTDLHPDLPEWLQDSLSHLNHFCAVLGPKPPDEKSLATDPTSKELAPLVCCQAKSMVKDSMKLGCDRWWKPLDVAVLEPLRQEIKTAKAEIEKIDEELKTEGLPFQRRNELGERKHELKVKIKSIKADHDEKSDRAKKVRSQIEKWACPEAETWETWLSAQPLFDSVASLDGQRPPPQSIADFITQESRYAPDINDGVRVNIAPIQKAGLLHADVLDAKDADKAIADRAEWRSDERRWVREGKLPQPGWWKTNNVL